MPSAGGSGPGGSWRTQGISVHPVTSAAYVAMRWFTKISRAGFSEPVHPTCASKATSSTKPVTTFLWAIVTHLPFWNYLGEQVGGLEGAEHPTSS